MRFMIAVALILLPSLATAQTPTTPAATPSPAIKEKKICRTEATTGTMFTSRVCRTKAEWEQIDDVNRANVEHYHNDRTASAPAR